MKAVEFCPDLRAKAYVKNFFSIELCQGRPSDVHLSELNEFAIIYSFGDSQASLELYLSRQSHVERSHGQPSSAGGLRVIRVVLLSVLS